MWMMAAVKNGRIERVSGTKCGSRVRFSIGMARVEIRSLAALCPVKQRFRSNGIRIAFWLGRGGEGDRGRRLTPNVVF